MFKNFGKDLGESIETGSKVIQKSAKEIGGKLEKIGNIEKAAKEIKTGLIISSSIVMGGIILNTLLKKI